MFATMRATLTAFGLLASAHVAAGGFAHANGVLIADVEGDGDLDIIVGGQYVADAGYESSPRPWRNDGTSHFAEDRGAYSDLDDRRLPQPCTAD